MSGGAIDSLRRSARKRCASTEETSEGRRRRRALGGDDDLTPATRDAFRASGLGHLLAVSGQNVVLLVAAILVVGEDGSASRGRRRSDRDPARPSSTSSSSDRARRSCAPASRASSSLRHVACEPARSPLARARRRRGGMSLARSVGRRSLQGFQLSFVAVLTDLPGRAAPAPHGWRHVGARAPAQRAARGLDRLHARDRADRVDYSSTRSRSSAAFPASLAALPTVAAPVGSGSPRRSCIRSSCHGRASALALAAGASADYLVRGRGFGAWTGGERALTPGVPELAGLPRRSLVLVWTACAGWCARPGWRSDPRSPCCRARGVREGQARGRRRGAMRVLRSSTWVEARP